MTSLESLRIVQEKLFPEFLFLKKQKKASLERFVTARTDFIKAVGDELLLCSDTDGSDTEGIIKSVFLSKNKKGKFIVYDLVESGIDFTHLTVRNGCIEIADHLLLGGKNLDLQECVDFFNSTAKSSAIANFADISIKKYLRVEGYCLSILLR